MDDDWEGIYLCYYKFENQKKIRKVWGKGDVMIGGYIPNFFKHVSKIPI